jgi:hypothetical protein
MSSLCNGDVIFIVALPSRVTINLEKRDNGEAPGGSGIPRSQEAPGNLVSAICGFEGLHGSTGSIVVRQVPWKPAIQETLGDEWKFGLRR